MTPPRTALSELRKLCEGATSGKWYALTNDLNMSGVFSGGGQVCFATSRKDADFIAGADPITVTLLLDEITALRGALDFYSKIKLGDLYYRESPIGLVALNKDVGAMARAVLSQSKERLPE